MSVNRRLRNWCLTLNNPAMDEVAFAALFTAHVHFKYLVFQKEKQTVEHYQAYVEFYKPLRFGGIKALCPRAHIEARRGTRQQCIDYCKKPSTRIDGPWEYGETESKQGKRNDLSDLAMAVKAGATNEALFDLNPGLVLRMNRHIDRLRSWFKPTRTKDLDVILRYGKPGTGKTESCHTDYPDLFRLPVSKDLWMDNYQQEKAVLIDDFAGNVGLSQLLQIIDKYPIQVPIKGAFVWWCPDVIIITTNVHPMKWYDYTTRQDSWKAVTRRFSTIWWHREDMPAKKIESFSFFNRWAFGCDENEVFIDAECDTTIDVEASCNTTIELSFSDDLEELSVHATLERQDAQYFSGSGSDEI